MEITTTEFKAVIDPTLIHKAGMHKVETVVARISKFYCRPMTTAGNCPQKCSLCKERIEGSLKKIDPSKAKSAYAILTWQMKNLHSQCAEMKPHTVTVKKNQFGEKVETNLFDELMSVYG